MTVPLLDRRPWHGGEATAQRLAGAPERPPVIRTFVTEQLRDFFGGLTLVFAAGLDEGDHLAASLLRGAPGFISSPEPRRVEIAARFPEGEPLLRTTGAPLGLIGVDFATRRRNRINGRVDSSRPEALALAVDEAFGNCPKYIAPREPFAGAEPGAWSALPVLDDATRDKIERADVFFVASRGPDGVDMSHRGGPPGFVQILGDGTLKILDFPGNNYFNTFGNLLHDPRAALLFPDFFEGTALHLAGEARVSLAGDERFWTFTPREARIWRGD